MIVAYKLFSMQFIEGTLGTAGFAVFAVVKGGRITATIAAAVATFCSSHEGGPMNFLDWRKLP